MVKRYEELTISDDFMFGKAMGDKVLCRDVLERLLEEKVGELEDVQPQRSSGILRVASRFVWICIRGIKSVCTMQRCRI